ncbi:MAG: hypothetical protein IBX48_06410 [Thiomicrospira sp.]|uniref:DUF6746 family protein n=1 Tax=Thiomicrospira sp. TaxID=935 RepID=UPI0019FC3600|nr:DUF6746 family protein [Thiomicrospira sp.]MBE0493959.1 hypothetical protein [Thiomicrospira sp.]
MIKKTILTLAFVSIFALQGTAIASNDKAQHFKGQPSHTLEQAVKNFSEYNKKLAVIMQKEKLEPVDMAEIHELTYTLENALEKIENALEQIEDDLEDVHQASEKGQYDKALKKGRAYLKNAQTIIP